MKDHLRELSGKAAENPGETMLYRYEYSILPVRPVLITILCLMLQLAWGQGTRTPFKEWVAEDGVQEHFYKCPTVTDGSSNVYRCGATLNGNGDYDIYVTKHNSSGTLQWSVTYAGAGGDDDVGTSLKLDGSGNVYVTGTVYSSANDSNDCVLLKYNPGGLHQWTARYDGGQGRNDSGADLVIDNNDIYVVGTTWSNSTDKYDLLALKYNNSGALQWVKKRDNVDMWDAGYKAAFRNGELTVSGGTQTTATKYEYATLKYSSSGSLLSANVTSGNNNIGFNKVTGLVVDANGDIYITGAAMNLNYDYYTVKLNAQLTQQWTATYNGSSNLDDVVNDIEIDASGNVYVTGYSTSSTQGKNYVTVKYNSTGAQQWAVSYNSSDNLEDEAYALVLDNSNAVYVTGGSTKKGNMDFMTIKYSSSGTLQWSIPYNSDLNHKDKATDICIDASGNILVAGQAEGSRSNTYIVVKYSEKNVITPPDPVAINPMYAYVENRGQVIGTNGSNVTGVEYYNFEFSPQMYFMDDTVAYVLTDVDTGTIDSVCRVSLSFNSSNAGDIRAYDQRKDHYNFYYPQVIQGRPRVPLYNRLVDLNVWSHIDVQHASNSKGGKMYFIVKPTGKPNDISMNFTGSTGLSVNGNGDLVIATAYGNIIYPKADAFEIDASGNYINLSWQPSYSITGSTVKFSGLGSFNTSNALVLAMDFGSFTSTPPGNGNMDWSTHYGNPNMNDLFNTVCNDSIGNIYVGGHTNDPAFPVFNSPTPYQQTLGGMYDGVVLKFDGAAELEWATYYGGNREERIWGIAYNHKVSDEQLYIVGQTQSIASTIPLFAPADTNAYYDTINTVYTNIGEDGFLLRMDTASGAISWATLFGGTMADTVSSVAFTPSGDVYIIGNTSSNVAGNSSSPVCKYPSNDGFPLCDPGSGAYYQSTFGGGISDGFIAMFDTSNVLKWSTYYGSAEVDGIFEVNAMQTYPFDVYIGGRTQSLAASNINCNVPTNGGFPSCKTDSSEYHQLNGESFLSRFTPSGVLRYSTRIPWLMAAQTVVTTDQRLVAIAGLASGFAYLTCSDSAAGLSICTPPGAYQEAPWLVDRALYVMKFNDLNRLVWSTAYGTQIPQNVNIGSGGLHAHNRWIDGIFDSDHNLYISSAVPYYSYSQQMNVVYNPAFYNQAINNGSVSDAVDAYIACFRDNNTLAWSSHVGGSSSTSAEYGTDIIRGISSYKNKAIYIAGYSNTDSFPAFCPVAPNPSCYTESGGGSTSLAFISRLNMSNINVQVEEIEKRKELSVALYPNPANDNFTIEIGGTSGMEKMSIFIYNSIGQIVEQTELTGNKKEISVSGWAKGFYSVQIRIGDVSLNKKLIVH